MPGRTGVGIRLLAFVLLFSSVVTLGSTLVQLYWDFRRDAQLIEARLDEIEQSTAGSLSASLWTVDLDQLRLQLEGLMLTPSLLELEITEGVVMDEAPEIAANLRHLCELGVRLSIDDFGTGYSSLAYLQRYPFDTLKIDRAFVANAGQDEAVARLVETIIAMARALGLETIAEGVETPAQRDFLSARGCDLLQGYLLGRPAPQALREMRQSGEIARLLAEDEQAIAQARARSSL